MLRFRLNPTASPAPTLVSAEAEGYKSLSATAVPARTQLRSSAAACIGPACARGLRPISAKPQSLRLTRVPRRWAEVPAEPRFFGMLSFTASGARGLRAPQCLSGGLVQLASN